MSSRIKFMDKKIKDILSDPCASYWLKNALQSSLDRDCVDAANDAEVLAETLRERAHVLNTTNFHLKG